MKPIIGALVILFTVQVALAQTPKVAHRVLAAENARHIAIINDKDDKIVKEIALTVATPSSHRDTRMVRKLDNGHYLVCHEGDGKVREYDADGKVVWTYSMELGDGPVTAGHEGHGINVFGSIRL